MMFPVESSDDGGISTILNGAIAAQVALQGPLVRIRDMRLPRLPVQCLGQEENHEEVLLE